MNSRTCFKTAIAFCGIALLSAAESAPVWAAKEKTFVFRTLIDTTPVGGEPDTLLTVTYTFDPDLPSDWDYFDSGWYSPVHVMIQVGDQIVWGTHDTAIIVWNNLSDSDGYDVRLSRRYWGNSVHGSLFGLELGFFRFLIVDTDEDMFDTARLPLTPDFAMQADFQQTDLVLFDPLTGEQIHLGVNEYAGTPPEELTPFSLEEVTK